MEKVSPRTLSGFMELLPERQVLFDKMVEKLRDSFSLYGFTPLDTPIIESSEILLAKAGGETEKQIYRFKKGDSDLCLRFDLTVPLAKYVAMHGNELAFPFRRYQIGKVYRGERAQRGRFREFYQADIDVIGDGALDIINEAEIPSIIYRSFTMLGLERFVIRINNRKVLNGLFQILDIGDKASDVMRTIDKIDKIGENSVKSSLINDIGIDIINAEEIISVITGRKLGDRMVSSEIINDDSCYIKNYNNEINNINHNDNNYHYNNNNWFDVKKIINDLNAQFIDTNLITVNNNQRRLNKHHLNFDNLKNYPNILEQIYRLSKYRGINNTFDQGLAELSTVAIYMAAFGVPNTHFDIDLKIARGLDYYTGTVYETTMTDHSDIGSICSGGRYDNLAEYYTDRKLPGVGISIGLTRLFFVLEDKGYLNGDLLTSPADVLILPMTDDLAPAIILATTMRQAGIRVQVHNEDKKYRSKVSYADKLKIPYVIFLGEDEILTGRVTYKEMKTGEQETVSSAMITTAIKNKLAKLRIGAPIKEPNE